MFIEEDCEGSRSAAATATAAAGCEGRTAAPVRQAPALQSRTDAAGDAGVIQARMAEVRLLLDALSKRTLTAAEGANRDRVSSLLDLARKAFTAGNLRQADDLSSRAAMLAKTIDVP